MGVDPEAVIRLTLGVTQATYTSAVKKWLKQ
jgi:hypothetical protein